MMSDKKENKVESVVELSRAIQYLEDVAASLKSGSVSVEGMNGMLTLTPEPTVKLKIEATQKSSKESLSLKVSWRKGEMVGEPTDIRVSAGPPAPSDEPEEG